MAPQGGESPPAATGADACYDEVVTPTGTAFVGEPGVTNEHVQDSCLLDRRAHCEAYDLNVRHLAENALDPARGHADRDLELRFPGLIGRGGRGRLRAELSSPGRDRLAAIPPAGGIAPRSAPVGLLLEIVEGVLRPTDG